MGYLSWYGAYNLHAEGTNSCFMSPHVQQWTCKKTLTCGFYAQLCPWCWFWSCL